MYVRWELPQHGHFAASATTHTHSIVRMCMCSILRAIGLWITRILQSIQSVCTVVKRIDAKYNLEIWWIKTKEGNRFRKWEWRYRLLVCEEATQTKKKRSILSNSRHTQSKVMFLFFVASTSRFIWMNWQCKAFHLH